MNRPSAVPDHAEPITGIFKTMLRPSTLFPDAMWNEAVAVCPKCKVEHPDPGSCITIACGCGCSMRFENGSWAWLEKEQQPSIDDLTTAYDEWNKANGLDLGSADEHMFDENLTEEQRAWIRDFCGRWDDAESRET